jgi:hypothetical protein
MAKNIASEIAMQREYNLQIQTLNKLDQQMVAQDEEIARLDDANHTEMPEEMGQLVQQRQRDCEVNPADIAPEDALDTIVRLENHMKLEQRRNDLIKKENDVKRLRLKERQVVLMKAVKAKDHLMAVTGWDGKAHSEGEQAEVTTQIEDMRKLEVTLVEEHKAAKVIIAKKSQLVEFLQAQVAAKLVLVEELNVLHNDTLVKDRELQELLVDTDAVMQQDHAKNNQLVDARNGQDVVAFQCLEQDNAFLRGENKGKKEKRKNQDATNKAQLHRMKQLTQRLEVIVAAIHDLGIDADYNQHIAQTVVLPPSSGSGEADDMDRILPQDELVSVETFELLHRDLQTMRDVTARKDCMVLEKNNVLDALIDKFDVFNRNLERASTTQGYVKGEKVSEMQHLHTTLAEQHTQFRSKIDHLLNTNLKLKNKLSEMNDVR